MNTSTLGLVGGALRTGGAALVWLALGFIPLRGAEPALRPAPVPGDLRAAGTVNFPITGAAKVQPEFAHGVALLHSFFYEEARRVFTHVAEQDPGCAMAQWGIAMTWWHPIWAAPTPDELRAGRAAADRAVAMPVGDARERGFIAAIAAFYSVAGKPADGPVGQSCHGPVGPLEPVLAYEKAMRELRDKFPDDFETQVFYALALLGVGYATPTDTTLAHQLQAAEMLENLWRQSPNHPGVVHYLIHSYDYPSLAERGLPAARAYAAIAPWVPHALHMPSHIFTRLGMWEESVAANQAAAEASRAYAISRHRRATAAEELHALDYMVYSYLQTAQDVPAKAVVDFVRQSGKPPPEVIFQAAYGLAAIPARYALERKDWAEAARLPVPDLPHWKEFPFLEGMTEYAHAIGRARLGDVAGARAAMARMDQLREETKDIKFEYFRLHLLLQSQAVAAWIAAAEGKTDEALASLRGAADAEDLLGKNPVSPGALVPMREQLGDLLLQLGRPKDARVEYEASLKIYPGRFQALYGAGLAAERSGDAGGARDYYVKLAQQTPKADGSRPEMRHLREYLGTDASQ